MTVEDVKGYLRESQTISIHELCDKGFNFIIPSYQRGFRWTKDEVERLMKDVLAYSQEKDGDYYCLQPLVVRHISDGEKHQWRVIDGQQRLTTIYLALISLEQYNCYMLAYERDDILTKMFDERKRLDKDDNCEIYHLVTAKEVIDSFIKTNKTKCGSLKDNILDKCRFILYVMKEDNASSNDELDKIEHDLFNHLNSGKIPLTESELIKALFLHNIGEREQVKEVKQISMAEELDAMERTLRKDEMWFFLAGDSPKPSSCIDYLYKVWFISQNGSLPNNIDNPIFSSLEDRISAGPQMWLEQWDEIRKCFYTITGWYDDPLMYNLIGYLEGRKVQKDYSKDRAQFHEVLLADLYGYATKKNESGHLPTKKEFLKYIKGKCLESIPKEVQRIRYDNDKNAVFNTLFLVNIAMMINNKNSQQSTEKGKATGKGSESKISRFPFHVFHTLNWNVEHISPRAPQDKSKLYNQLCELLNEYENTLPGEVGELYKKMGNYKDNLDALDNDSEYLELLRKLVPDKDEVNEIKNLTLLTEHDNKGIGNKFYFDKRNKLNEYQAQGSFIPAATLNVFSKWYTKHPDGYVLWGSKDQEAYEQAIFDTITNFKDYCNEE